MAPAAPRRASRRANRFSKPLTREKIAAAAIDIVRREGQGAISMRKVAGLFDVDVAALYRHFRNKDELLAEVGRLASEIVDLDAPTEGSWEDRLVALGETIRDRLVRHPELGIHGGESPWTTPFLARANARIADLLLEAGLRGEPLVYGTQAVLHLVTSVARSEELTAATPRARNREFARRIHDQLSAEVQAAWPATTAATAWTVDFDAFFRFALRAAIEGVVRAAAHPR